MSVGSALALEQPSGEEEDRPGREQGDLAPHVAPENAIEERDAGHDQSCELEPAREEVHGALTAWAPRRP